jgi:hypothetical protein
MEKIVLDAASFVAFLDLLNQPPRELLASREILSTPSVLERASAPAQKTHPWL